MENEIDKTEVVAGLFGLITARLEDAHEASVSPLKEIEACHPKEDRAKCKDARHFVLRIVPDLAFVAGLPARLLAAHDEEEKAIPLVVATLGSCVREGCESPENLASRLAIGRSVSRVAARKKYEELLPHFEDGEPNEPFENAMDRCRKASALSLFKDL